MKKYIISIVMIISGFVLFNTNVFAQEVKTNLSDCVKEEIEIFGKSSNYDEEVNTLKSIDLSGYKESDDKINVYLFRGSTCSHCLEAIVFFAKNAANYGKYFNIVSYEVWNNKDNATLMNKVANVLGEKASGVPFIVIGNKAYSGFSESIGNDMLNQIKTMYDSKDKYNVLDHIEESKTSPVVIIVLIVLVILIGVGFIIYVSKSSK